MRMYLKKLSLLFVAFLLAGCDSFDSFRKFHAELDVTERIGVLAHLDITWQNSTAAFLRALAHFQAEGVDKVVILGDPTKDGYPHQREVFELAWKKAYAKSTPPERILAPREYVISGVTFASEGRFPLTDLLCVHPSDGRRVNAGSMHGIDVSDIFEKQGGSSAGKISSSAQGLLVLVREEGLEIRRLDFSGASAEEVGPPWRTDKAGLIASEAESVPRFWEDTLVNVTPGYDARGKRLYSIRWPSVLAQFTGARAFSYDVTVGEKLLMRVQSPGFFLPESRDREAVRCAVYASALEGRAPRFGITPISSLGKRGPTVWSK